MYEESIDHFADFAQDKVSAQGRLTVTLEAARLGAAAAVWLLTFLGLARQMVYAVLLWLRRPHILHLEQPGGQTAVGAKTGGVTQ